MGELKGRVDYADRVLLYAHRREGLTREEQIRSGTIKIIDGLPADPAQAVLAMELDAAQIADVLWETLPGGTVDMLIAELMGRRASVLRVGLLSVDEIARLQRERAAEVSGSHGETTTGAGGGADTLASAEGNGEPVGLWVEMPPASFPDAYERCRFHRGGKRCAWDWSHDESIQPHGF